MVPAISATMGTMPVDDFNARFLEAMRLSGRGVHDLVEHLGISYQAVMKVCSGKTKRLRADHSVMAARFMNVDPDWLATGTGRPAAANAWPLSADLLAALRACDSTELHRAENMLRLHLGLQLVAADPAPAISKRTGTNG
jgi:hypothetical protein